MNDKIVKNAASNFIQNTGINSSTLREAYERFLWESIRDVRRDDPFLYDEMRCLSTMAQTNLLEQRLFMEVANIDEIVQTIGEAAVNALEKAHNLNEFTGENYTEEYARTLLEDTLLFLAEDSKLKEIGQHIKGKFTAEVAPKVWGGYVKPLLTFLAQAFTHLSPALLAGGGLYFGVTGFLTSFIIFIVMIIVLGIAHYGLGRSYAREQIELVNKVAHVLFMLAKWIKKGTEKYKWLYQMSYKNEEKCYIKAGVDPKKIGWRTFLGMKDDPDSFLKWITPYTTEEKIDKLRTCFLENFLDRISIFFDLYFDCLKKTGNWNEVRSMSDDKFISMFRMKGNLYASCDQFRDNAVKAINTYQDLVEYLFEKDPQKKSQWMLLLNRYILDKKNSQENIKKEFHRQNDKKYSTFSHTDKFKRLTQGIDHKED